MRIFLLLSLVLCLVSCKNKSTKDYIIPRDKFREILVHLNLVDGYYASNYNQNYLNRDTVFYQEVFAKYNCSRAQFDSTFKYYTNHPKKFDEICDEMITELQKMEQENFLLNAFITDSAKNIYKGKKHWILPRDGMTQRIPFSIAIKDTGNYTIAVQLKLLSSDHAKNPRLTAYFWYKDGTKEGFRDDFEKTPYKITPGFAVYKVTKRLRSRKVTHIKGWILDYDPYKYAYRFVEVKNISIKRGY
jgi:hypothetical protein